jgi:dGTPase
LRPADADAIRGHHEPVAGFSPVVGEALQTLREFLYSRMYNHDKVKRMQRKARQVVRELFAGLLERPGCLPPDWQARAGAPGDARTAEAIGDYIAGMTDRFALQEHKRLFDLSSGI